jgi:hypothetical protein
MFIPNYLLYFILTKSLNIEYDEYDTEKNPIMLLAINSIKINE